MNLLKKFADSFLTKEIEWYQWFANLLSSELQECRAKISILESTLETAKDETEHASDWAKTAEQSLLEVKKENLELHKKLNDAVDDREGYINRAVKKGIKEGVHKQIQSSLSLAAKAASLSVEEMREKLNFSVYEADDGKWECFMNICSLGGCDFSAISFDTEREAVTYAYILSVLGQTPDSSCPCSECYSEYMQQCV